VRIDVPDPCFSPWQAWKSPGRSSTSGAAIQSRDDFGLVWSNILVMSQNEARPSTLRRASADAATTLSSDAPGARVGSGDASSPEGERDAPVAFFPVAVRFGGKAGGDEGVAATVKRRGVASTQSQTASFQLRVLSPILFSLFLLAGSPAQARPKFIANEIAGSGQQLMICDLDGDGLKDLVLMDDTYLLIFYKNPQRGFTRKLQQIHQLEPRPCLVWTATLGGPADSLLVMTSDGVTELGFTNRTGPPTSRQIIRQATIVPEKAETNALFLSLSAKTGLRHPEVPATTDRIPASQNGFPMTQDQFKPKCAALSFFAATTASLRTPAKTGKAAALPYH
jgi:hypothetical protein